MTAGATAAATATATATAKAAFASRLPFEHGPLLLEEKVRGLRELQAAGSVDLQPEIAVLQDKVEAAWNRLYDGLTPWQIVQVARHPKRPYTLDYIDALFTDFVELHGDRAGFDDAAIVGGLARFEGRPIVVLGHQKGRDVKERTQRNFGMPRPEGYRKALRLMEMADQFGLPLVSFIDTPGAFPGIDAEERGQSAAIGQAIYRMSQLQVPTVAVVIGEGGSGGALAIGVADRMCMLEYSVYSVISPEGCASILWKDAAHAETAARALGLSARHLHGLGLVDQVVTEPTGGAHRDPAKAAEYVGRALRDALAVLREQPTVERTAARHERLRRIGSIENAEVA